MTETVTEDVVWALWQGLPERVIKRTTKRTVVMVTEEWKPKRPMGKVFATFAEAQAEAIRQAQISWDAEQRHIAEAEETMRELVAQQAALEKMTEPEG